MSHKNDSRVLFAVLGIAAIFLAATAVASWSGKSRHIVEDATALPTAPKTAPKTSRFVMNTIFDMPNAPDATKPASPRDRIYIHNDKPLYKPNETIWYQVYVRNESDLKASEQSDVVYVEFVNPKGNVEKAQRLIAPNGIASGDIQLGEFQLGGIYKLRAFTLWQKNLPDSLLYEKEIQIQSVVLPRLKMKLEFDRKAFGAGDEVVAKFEATTLDNKPLADKDFTVQASLGGKEYLRKPDKTGADGKSLVRFTLPKTLATNDGLLTLLISHEGQQESISRSIPIVLNNIALTFYPEGGDLIDGLKTAVAFEARNEFGKPADIEGAVVDDQDKVITEFKSFHQGMGAFLITPTGKESVKITKPEGITKKYALPKPKSNGIALSVDALSSKSAVKAMLRAKKASEGTLIGSMRGKMYFKKEIALNAGETTVDIPTADLPAGVLQLTLLDNAGVEQAERLVFTGKARLMSVTVKTDKEKYLPREKVELAVKTLDENGKPISAALSLAVVDDKLLSFADDKQGNILSKLLFEPDLKGDIDEPNFYFDPKEQKAEQALDYLMMTRGWRKFEWKPLMKNAFQPERLIVAGTVVDGASQQPMSGIKITLIDTSKKTVAETLTNESGQFAIRYVDFSQPVTVRLEKEGYYKRERTLTEQPRLLRAEMWKRESGAGVIVGQAIYYGRPIVGAKVQLKDTRFEAVTDSNGAYTFVGVPLKNYVVQFNHQTYGEYSVKAMPTADAVARADFDYAKMALPVPAMARNLRGFGGGEVDEAIGFAAPGGALREPMRAEAKNGMPPQIDNEVADAALNVATAPILGEEAVQEVIVDQKRKEQAVEKDMEAKPARQRFGRMPTKPFIPEAQYQIMPFYRARVFAAPDYSKDQTPKTRTDFRSTVFWKSNLITDATTGEAKLSFYNSDDVTSFRITVEGVAEQGLVGRHESTFFTQLPFSMAVKVPTEVSMGDRVLIPLTIANNTDKSVTGNLVVTAPKGWKPLSAPGSLKSVEASTTTTEYLAYDIENQPGKGNFEISFSSAGLSDAFAQEVTIKPKGFPQSLSFSSGEKEASYAVKISEPIAGTLRARVAAYPSVQSTLMAGVDGLLREPYGCFEQTSSSNYPNVIVLNYLREFDVKDVAVFTKASKLLDAGYKKLVSFETKQKGYEWFGGTPAHEALTAYGLMEFRDMQPVYAGLDNTMVKRTGEWLLSRRDGKGGFMRDPKALDSFGRASEDVTNAYITYALAEAGYKAEIVKELDHAFNAALKSNDAYQLALVANAAFSAGEKAKAMKAIELLVKLQQPNGSWSGKQSITCSGGQGLTVETTSLAAMALLKSKSEIPALNNAVKFISQARSGYGDFGSTQATILALKCLTEYAKFSRQTAESGAVEVFVDGKSVAKRAYQAGVTDAIEIGGLESAVSAQTKEIRVRAGGEKYPLPHAVLISWNTLLPRSSDSCKVRLETMLAATTCTMGETVRLTTRLKNITKDGLPMTVAIVGIPAGLSAQPWQLKELQEKKAFDFYEISGREVVFYYRQMLPDEVRDINLDLKADIPGRFEAPASRAYLYYTKEHKSWTAAEAIDINTP
ncbi:MAG: hypothetical protein HY22_08460 [[Candidatus Thermochlorobacteriaceae] bacterium GBChlB]|nr:MAG: hypothetical protein HY22_08460 [[Candidatus Thermochlorobacteriaceae] bacterium GBChlB]